MKREKDIFLIRSSIWIYELASLDGNKKRLTTVIFFSSSLLLLLLVILCSRALTYVSKSPFLFP